MAGVPIATADTLHELPPEPTYKACAHCPQIGCRYVAIARAMDRAMVALEDHATWCRHPRPAEAA